ncbi:DUF2171 domain-containing protein [Rhodoplanes sp. TEM]|uniref:DUF2171 domain-containing protein n=1 Tax=Rhodoplanes tepidamans TaxID=200616 RepID=A0ABT5JDT0_RHOTP|nr:MULTISPECIES: DUF2171 domain-containing protein [Rhodoplanes]MDC7787787.1 DUF2171 domain-containing protein [Rhodoplanes tepidamans]MDC7982650.1 DUF2171 domain-containing protein [Rhodoplanes sp. TEM]MDQ0357703.1 hypothetical protein [Rhodoplanes tepidamans]
MPHNDIQAHMDVVGADDLPVGTVDRVDGDHIKLARTGPEAGGCHHLIPLAWVEEVDGKVHLSLVSDDAMAQWEPADL